MVASKALLYSWPRGVSAAEKVIATTQTLIQNFSLIYKLLANKEINVQVT